MISGEYDEQYKMDSGNLKTIQHLHKDYTYTTDMSPEDIEYFGDQIEWLPEDPALRIEKGEDDHDGSQTEAD